MEYPYISVITPCLNSSRTLAESLRSLRNQDYPQDKLELLLIDGGSTDGSQQIASSFGSRVIAGGYRDNMEARRSIGLFQAKHPLVFYLDTDNILPNSSWLSQMVRPFIEHEGLVASQAWRYGIKNGFSPFNRYCALLGANDPVAYYLGKSEKIPYLSDDWVLTPIKADYGDYFLVDFTSDNLPTVGANGFIIRRDLLLRSHCQPEEFFHIDVISDLVRDGYNPFAIVRSEIYHDTAGRLGSLAAKRMRYFIEHNPSLSARRYFVFDIHRKKDIQGLARFVFYSLTAIQPLLLALRGYRRRKDWAWFLHPIVCWNFLIAYTFSSVYLFLRTKYILARAKRKQCCNP